MSEPATFTVSNSSLFMPGDMIEIFSTNQPWYLKAKDAFIWEWCQMRARIRYDIYGIIEPKPRKPYTMKSLGIQRIVSVTNQ